MTDWWIKTPNDQWLRATGSAAYEALCNGWYVQLGIFGDLEIDLMGYDPQTSAESPLVGGCCDPTKIDV